MQIPYLDVGGAGEELVFLHANGYPPNCYQPLLSSLAEKYHVIAMVQRPLWPGSRPEEIEDWRPLTDDFLQFLDEHYAEPILCVGHSMGGMALLRAVLRAPERFQAIILLDPVLFPPDFIAFWHMMRRFKLGQALNPLVARARQRRREFDNLERLFRGYRQKFIFRYMSDDALRAYVEGIACPKDHGGYELCYSAEWEMHMYRIAIWPDMDVWNGLPNLGTPALILRGAETDTFWERTARLAQRKQPGIQVETLEKSTHLLPLERPAEVANRIQSFFEEKFPKVFS